MLKIQYYYLLITLCLGFIIPTQAQEKMNSTLASGGDVQNQLLSIDGDTLVYLADQDRDENFELYAVPYDKSSNPIKISGNLSGEKNVINFQLSNDNTTALYLVNGTELYAAPLDASNVPIKISHTLSNGSSIKSFQINQKGDKLLYNVDYDILYATPIDGSQAPVKLDEFIQNKGGISQSSMTKDGSQVFYTAYQDSMYIKEVYTIPFDASSPPLKLSNPLPEHVGVGYFILSHDETKLIYNTIKRNSTDFAPNSAEVDAIYTVSTNGASPAIKLTPTFVDFGRVGTFKLTKDDKTLVYKASQDSVQKTELYAIPADGTGSSIKISTSEVHTNQSIKEFFINNDGTKVFYSVVADLGWHFYTHGIFTSPIDASSPPTKISNRLVDDESIVVFKLSTNGEKIVYLVYEDAFDDSSYDHESSLYAVPSEGSQAAIKITNKENPDGYFHLSTNGERVVYFSYQPSVSDGFSSPPPSTFKLYSASTDIPKSSVQISVDKIDGWENSFTLNSDLTKIIYRADNDTKDVQELYKVLCNTCPSNDEYQYATKLEINESCSNFSASTKVATASEIENPTIPNPTCGNYRGGDVWFKVHISAVEDVSFSLTSSGEITDAGMALYTQTTASLVLIDCVDGMGQMPTIKRGDLPLDSTVFIRVWENGNNISGDFNICVNYLLEAPTELTGESISSSQIDLFWIDNSTNETGFIVLRDGIAIDTLAPNTTSFSDTGLTANTYYNYKIRAFNAKTSTTTNTLSIATLPLQPSIVNVIHACEGSRAYIELTGQGFYRYYDSITSGNIIGESSRGLFVTSVLTQNMTFYAVAVVEDRESTPRVAIPIEVTKKIKAELIQEGDEFFTCEGSMEVEALEQDGATYQWKRGSIVLDETSTKLNINQSATYQLIVNKNACKAFFYFKVSLNYKPDASVEGGDEVAFCDSGTLKPATVKPSNTYKWFKGGNMISTATNITVSDSGIYTLEVTENTCVNSKDVQVSILKIADNQIISAPKTKICPNEKLDLTIVPTQGASYRWYRDNELVLEAKENTYQISESGTYQAEIYSNGGDCSKFSEKIIISTFNAPPVILTNNNGILELEISNQFEKIDWFTNDNQVLPDYQNEINITPGLGIYWAEVTYTDGTCIVKSNPVQGSEVPPTGFEDEEAENISFEIFPNPSQNGIFNIRIEKNLEANLKFELTDALGHNIPIQIKGDKANWKLDLSQFAKGVYYLKVIQKEYFVINKLVKK